MTDEPGSTPKTEQREFEDLTLAEAVGDLLRRPFETLRYFSAVTHPVRKEKRISVWRPVGSDEFVAESALDVEPVDRTHRWRLALMVWAFLTAMFGNLALVQPNPGERLGLLRDVPMSSAYLLWFIAAALMIAAIRFTRPPQTSEFVWYELSEGVGFRPLWLVLGLPPLVAAFFLSSDNRFTAPGVSAWVFGIFAVAWAFTPRGLNPLRGLGRGVDALRRFRLEEPQVAAVLVVILLVAAYARFNGLGAMPAEMTSDHIEKLMDSQRVFEGDRDIFFANNGGREPFQMYLLAVMGGISGQPLSFAHLKVAAALESLLGIPLLFVLGRVAIGDRDRRLGTLLGLALALFAAVGYWHIATTRVSLRIMLTPLVTTIFLIYLIRFLRHNRREDAVMLGLTIGLGLYCYQALRMLPVVAVVAAAFMVTFIATSWRQRFATAFNLVVIAVVSFAVFVPLFKYSTEHPEEFWRRAQGRLLGEDIISDTRADGTIFERSPTVLERAAALAKNLPALGENMVRALGMFTYRGDVAWLHNAPNYPVFDPVAGAFLIVGAVGWAIWSIQSREYAALFLLAVLLMMLFPSAVAIANPIENPSNTRTSGAMPVAYLLAAFGAVGLVAALGDVLPRRMMTAGAAIVLGGAAIISFSWTNMVVFGPYNDYYQDSWSPQHEAGAFMRGFVDSDGAWGNIFMLSSAHFFDYRGVAVEAGLLPSEFPNGDIQLLSMPQRILDNLTRTDKYRFDPDRYLMVMYQFDADGESDEAVTETLETWFPQGLMMVIDTRQATPWLYNERYTVFRVPPLGDEGWREFLRAQGLDVPVTSE